MKIFSFKKNRKLNGGFTLVETLVAISILMLSVTGPLYFASESLKAAVYARDQITAFYLAQDAFEQIRKIRDDNVFFDNDNWYEGLQQCESLCSVTDSSGNFFSLTPDTPAKYLYINEDSGAYTHDNSGKQTIFKRSVKITPNDSAEWNSATEIKVTVKIDWTSKGWVRSFEAYEFLRKFN